MSEDIPAQQPPPHGILDKTFGEVIQNNPQAQNIVMKAMNINAQQLQEMIAKTSQNQLMHMTIRDMFKNGVMQQAASAQGQSLKVTPEQMQQIMNMTQNGEQVTPEQLEQITGQTVNEGQMTQSIEVQPQKTSLIQKLKGFLK